MCSTWTAATPWRTSGSALSCLKTSCTWMATPWAHCPRIPLSACARRAPSCQANSERAAHCQLRRANRRAQRWQVVHAEWGADLIASWNKHDWIGLPLRVAAKLARLIGANASEVLVADSTTVNLFKVAAAALQLRPDRHIIITGTPTTPHHHATSAMRGPKSRSAARQGRSRPVEA